MDGKQATNAPLMGAPGGYVYAQTPVMPLGMGGLPRANIHFASTCWGQAETNIRTPGYLCFTWAPGPNIPQHWYDGGDGWVTRFFTDVEPFSAEAKKNGIHACQVPNAMGQQCRFSVTNTGFCDGTPCWCSGTPAPLMAAHLTSAHGIFPPMKRPWSSELFDTTGCLDVWCCTPCQGARQMEALSGYANSFNVWWCLFFLFFGCRQSGHGRNRVAYYIPPHTLIAILTRYNVVRLNHIDEGLCSTVMIICCCSPCSVAQTYRELAAVGVWPGGICNNEPPHIVVPPPITAAPKMA